MGALLGRLVHWIRATGQIDGAQPSPFHDSPFYDVYACADGGFISLAAVEPAFHALLLSKLGLTDVNPAEQYETAKWPALKERIVALIRSRPRAHWCELLEGSDECVHLMPQHLEPQLARLMHHDEQHFVGVFGRRLHGLQGQQLVETQIAAVVDAARSVTHGAVRLV